jgi:acyl-CoA synthetase (AMP-forming)/AMP-acid ligase II
VPDRPAVIMACSGEVLTYRELHERSMRLAQLFAANGLAEGDRVAILAENHIRYCEVYWAAMLAGLYITGVNWHLTAAEASYIVTNSGAQALVTTTALAGNAARMLPELAGCPVRLIIDSPAASEADSAAASPGGGGPGGWAGTAIGAAAGFEPYEQAIARYPAGEVTGRRRGDVLLYSSGTTGRPKGVRGPLQDRTVQDGGGVSPLASAFMGMDDSTIYLSPAPLYHAAPLGWVTAVHELGGTAIVMERFTAEHFLELVERYRVTHSQLVPTMFVRMLKLPDDVRAKYDLSSLRQVVHAGAPCPPEVKRAMIGWWGPIISEYYSSTEGNSFTFITAREWLDHPGSVGKPRLGTPHICDEAGNELPPGEVGLIYSHRPDRSFEYLGDDEGTERTRHPVHPEWTTIGDMGYLDADGYLYLTDRKNFMIISGGVNIYPAEIEACLVMHPAVADVAVFGLPDPEMGEFTQAVVQPVEGVAGTPELAAELTAFARGRIAGYKVPRRIDFRESLPRMPTGKLAKGPLRAGYL